MANVGTSLKNWSTTEASNQPDGTDSATIAGDLRAIQAGVRYLRTNDTIASASTCDLGSKDAEYLSISGTTTITALGTVSAGIVKRVVFEGALTLTHNGTSLILPGAANITTAAGDAAEFVSLGGGNWRCTQYQKASGESIGKAPNVTDGDKGAITVSSGVWSLDSGVVEGAITASLGGFRNKIIGGDFTTNPWQRGTSFTAPATQTYIADRWVVSHSNDGVVNWLKTADAPTAAQAGVYSQHCLHADVTTADASIAAGQTSAVQQRIEGFNAASFGFGQSGTRNITLSFWHKHTKTGTYCVSFRNSAADRSYVAEYTQDVTNTWEKSTVSILVDTSGTWLYDTGIGLTVGFTLASGSNFQTTAGSWQAGNFNSTANQVNALDNVANDFKIALVQLESGSVASPYETRSVQQELALAQRYYYRATATSADSIFGAGFNQTTTTSVGNTQFPVPMRAKPTALEQSGTAGDYQIQHAATNTVCSSVPAFNSADIWQARTLFTVASGLTAGQGSMPRAVNTSAYLGWSAEL